MLVGLPFVLKIAWAIQALSWFHNDFRIVFFFYFFEKCHWSFDQDGIESVHCLGRMDILSKHFLFNYFLWRECESVSFSIYDATNHSPN